MRSSAAHRTVVVDPPWPYPGGFNGFGSRKKLPYRSMSVTCISKLPIAESLAREGYVFLWTTNKYLGDAFKILAGWGFSYRQTLTWCKPERGGLGGMFGTNVEFCLVAQNIRPGTNAHGSRTNRERIPTSWFEWKVRGHSEKPDEFYALVERVSPGPYLDVFARRARPGWTSIGDAIDGSDIVESLARSATQPARSDRGSMRVGQGALFGVAS